MEKSTQEIIRALRCSASPTVAPDEVCAACQYCISAEWEGIHIADCDCDRIALDAAERLEELESKAAVQWIRCDDRLPDRDGDYQVVVRTVFETVTIRHISELHFCAILGLWNAFDESKNYAFPPSRVTHWRELPGLPEE